MLVIVIIIIILIIYDYNFSSLRYSYKTFDFAKLQNFHKLWRLNLQNRMFYSIYG